MPFEFLKYLQPTHYFLLANKKGQRVYPKVTELPKTVTDCLMDLSYSTKEAKAYDASWQALHKGYIGNVATYTHFEALPLVDNYRFVRRYFSKAWVWYVLFVRLISGYNPLNEVKAFVKTKDVKRVDLSMMPQVYDALDTFTSPLVKAKPLVSVIIPTLNRYPYLEMVLKDLEAQDYRHFEVIVVDQSDAFNVEFYSPYTLDINVIHQKEKALWLARNTAIKAAKGDYLLFFDDDSRVEKDWIRQHLIALDYFNADISSGVSISTVGAKVPQHYAYYKISDQLDTGNTLIKRLVFERIGLFDRQFEKQRMGDGEFGLRAYMDGFKNVSNPNAKRLHLKVDSGGLREMGSWDAFRTTKLFAPRPIPSVLYFFRSYFGNTQARWALIRTVPMSIMPYRFKKNKPLLVLGIVVTIVLLPLVLFQVLSSWRLASRKIAEGALIEGFD